MTTRQRLLKLVAEDPGRSLADLAERLRVSRQRVAALLDAEGYRYVPGYWRRDPPASR